MFRRPSRRLFGAAGGGGGGGTLTRTWTDGATLTGTPAPPATFTGKNIGTPSADRFITLSCAWKGSSGTGSDITAVTYDVGGGDTPMVRAAYINLDGATRGRGMATWISAAPEPTGSTATFKLTYSNGWIDEFNINIGNITGSATVAQDSLVTSPAYLSGSNATAITVPANGVAIANGLVFENVSGGGSLNVSTWTNATKDNDQWTAPSNSEAVAAHLTASATVTLHLADESQAPWGWIASSFAPSFDAMTTAWEAAVVAAGGTVSNLQKNRVNVLIRALKNAPNGDLTAILDHLWMLAGESVSQQALIDIIGLTQATPHGTITLSAGGYLGDGSTGYLDTGIDPSIAGGHYALNSAHIGEYRDTTNGGIGIGTINTSGNAYAYISQGAFAGELNSGVFPAINFTTNGLRILSRTASTGWAAYRNGSATPTDTLTETSFGVPNNKFFICANCSNLGVAQSFCSDKIKAAWFGGGLTAAQTADLAAAVNAYMTAWGVNTY